jgi:uncharacterized membrane protein YdfJ with MMPL/SSD domain
VAAVAPPTLNPGKNLATITPVPSDGPSTTATETLVHAIRHDAPALRQDTGARVAVTGRTAINIDISQRMSDALIAYLTVVVGLALLRLMLACRSILVPLTAIAGFLLTIVASFGVVTLVFQEGVLAGLFGVAADRTAGRPAPDPHHRRDLRAGDGLPGVPRLAHARSGHPRREPAGRRPASATAPASSRRPG